MFSKTKAVRVSSLPIVSYYCKRNVAMFSGTSDSTPTKSFAMSCSGWLVPFHLGVIEKMRRTGYINDSTNFSGSSGGSLASLLACSNMPTEEALQAIITLSKDELFKKNIDLGMKKVLLPLMPPDILTQCNGRLELAVTKIWPNPKAQSTMVSEFHSINHLLSVVAASCFIPLYSGTMFQLLTKIEHATSTEIIENEYYIDGGVFAFMPPKGDIRVAPVPKRARRLFPRGTFPHIYLQDDDYRIHQLAYWALKPPGEVKLRELYMKGYEAAERWLKTQEGHDKMDMNSNNTTNTNTTTTSGDHPSSSNGTVV